MQTEFRLPALGADMDAGTIVEWHVAPGSRCKRGDVVAVVETDKGAIDVEVFVDGIVRELLVPPGTRVPVGTVLALLDTEAAATAPEKVQVPAETRAEERAAKAIAPRVKISPAARKRALEMHVDVASLRGTGPEGAITVADVERVGLTSQPSPAVAGEGAAGMRAAIAAAMSRSKREIPHYYLTTTVDVTPAVDWLAAHNAAVPVTGRLLLPVLLVKAVALACREHAGFSGFHRDGRYDESPVVHVGVAVALRGGGLVAPAIMDTADKPLAVLMEGFRDLVTRARAGRLRASELAASTIILTSLGEASVETVLPIIQPPQVAIVGAGVVAVRPWIVDGNIVPRHVLTLSLAADHRVTDGRLGAHFLARIAALLAAPAAL
ncbi:MAG: 2-oxo acid dehydrogenase subunit E2 [Proteobacteria bacterium]|nr:2-oxo acid dehydrogenase subunit E2 [Pseudomonadota bacterium]